MRNQVLKNAYGNDDTVIAGLDPRILLIWYLFAGIVPWFVSNLWFLMGCFILVLVTTWMARVAGLVLLLLSFAVGVFSQTGYLLIVSLFFGGECVYCRPAADSDVESGDLLTGVDHGFFGLDPDRLSNGLMVRLPRAALFSISYAYRVLPMLMESFRAYCSIVCGKSSESESLFGKIKYLCYQVKVIIHAFYPLMLNTAKRSRTTVEALEIKDTGMRR